MRCHREGCVALASILVPFLALGCNSSLSQAVPGAAAPAAPEPLFVVRVTPSPGRVELGPDALWRMTFSAPLDASTLSGAVIVRDVSSDAVVPGTARVEAAAVPPQADLIWEPTAGRMLPDERYSLTLAESVLSQEGASIDLEAMACETHDCPRFPLFYDSFQTVPQLAGNAAASATSCSSASVSWDAVVVSDNSPAGEISYRVTLGVDGAPPDPDRFVLETAPGVTSVSVEDLEPSTAYEVAVLAVDVVGNTSAPSGAAFFETPPLGRCDVNPPLFSGVSELSVGAAEPTVVVARWEAGSDDETPADALRYRVYIALESGEQEFSVPFLTSAPGVDELRVTGLMPNTTYYVVIRAADQTGNEDANRTELAATTPSSYRLTVRPIFDQRPPLGGNCTQIFCHSAPTDSGGLNLQSYDGLVNRGGITTVPPTVDPGNSRGSYLLWRTDESNPNFVRNRSRMPLGSFNPLAPHQLEAIRRWIDQGALNN